MKRLLLTLGLSVLTFSNAFAGGVEGGGGGTLPTKPITTLEADKIVFEGKRDIRLIMNNLSQMETGIRTEPLYQKLLFGPKTIFDVLETTDIEVLNKKPCFDRFGKEVDGSVLSSRPDAICISTFLIAPKLSREIAKQQIFALIMHELAHLIGANEQEAIEFQEEFAEHAARFYQENPSMYYAKMYYEATTAKSRISTFRDLALSGDDKDLATAADELSLFLSEYESKINNYSANISWNDWRREYFFELQIARAKLALGWAEGLVNTYSAKIYEEEFKGKLAITYCEKYGSHCGNIFGDHQIQKITNRQELKAQFDDLVKYFTNHGDYIIAQASYGPMPEFESEPWVLQNGNPWREFIGKYAVTFEGCTENGIPKNSVSNMVALEIFEQQNSGRLMFNEIQKNGFAHLSLESGDGDTWGTIFLNGDSNKAVKESISGDLWGQFHQVVRTELQSNKDGSYSLLVSRRTKQQDAWSGPAYNVRKCSYALTKQTRR